MNTSLPPTPRFENKAPQHHSEPKRAHRPAKSFSAVLDEVGEELFDKKEKKEPAQTDELALTQAAILARYQEDASFEPEIQKLSLTSEETFVAKSKIKESIPVEAPIPFFVSAQDTAVEELLAPPKVSLVATPVDFTQYFVELITACDLVDKAEYSFHLDSERFMNTPFYGMKIIVHEYKHAPKMFNIQLIASEAACQILAQHMPQMLNAFSTQTKFKIHRLEAELLNERSKSGSFVHKVKASSEKEDHTT